MLTLEADGGVIPTPEPTPGRRNLPLCHSDPRANARGGGICFPSTVIEFQVFYEPQNSYRYSRRHRRRRPEIHPDAGAPPLVRSDLAGRFRPLRGQALCRSSALEAQDSDSVRSRRHDGRRRPLLRARRKLFLPPSTLPLQPNSSPVLPTPAAPWSRTRAPCACRKTCRS